MGGINLQVLRRLLEQHDHNGSPSRSELEKTFGIGYAELRALAAGR